VITEKNTKLDRDPRMIKIEKSTSKKRIKNGINLVKYCKGDDFNEFEDIFQHIIPIMEYAKPFKEKLRKINYKLFPLAQRKLH